MNLDKSFSRSRDPLHSTVSSGDEQREGLLMVIKHEFLEDPQLPFYSCSERHIHLEEVSRPK